MAVTALADEPTLPTVTVTHAAVEGSGRRQRSKAAVEGSGAETGVMRRDPSDMIRVSDLYDVWYSKGKINQPQRSQRLTISFVDQPLLPW